MHRRDKEEVREGADNMIDFIIKKLASSHDTGSMTMHTSN